MRYLVVVLMLSGCANDARRAPESFDAASREPVCARSCLDSYSRCISGVSGLSGSVANATFEACQLNTKQCLSTCPAK